MNRCCCWAWAAWSAGLFPSVVTAWDERGHAVITVAAQRRLPDDVPAWVRRPCAQQRLVFLSSEPDRWRNVQAAPMGHINSPDHYFDFEWLDHYGLTPATLPKYRHEFIALLAAQDARHPNRTNPFVPEHDPEHNQAWPGLAPYRIGELFVKLRSSWRTLNTYAMFDDVVADAVIETCRDNVLHHMGLMSHYVGDVAQPLHTTVHFRGWRGPNPRGFTTDEGFHSFIDGKLIDLGGIGVADVLRDMPPAVPVARDRLFETVVEYAHESFQLVVPMYELEKRGGFRADGARFAEGVEFARHRLQAAAVMLNALWVSAYRDAGIDAFRARRLKRRRDLGGRSEQTLDTQGVDQE